MTFGPAAVDCGGIMLGASGDDQADLHMDISLQVVGQDAHSNAKIQSFCQPLGIAFRLHRSGDDFLNSLNEDQPFCLISELRAPGVDVFTLLEQLRKREWFVPLIVLTEQIDIRTTVAVMRAGAMTVVLKPLHGTELDEAIHQAILMEQRYRNLFTYRREVAARLAQLTAQEKAVLQLMVEGLPNKSIATKLDVSLRTVEGRRRDVFDKLQATSLAEAVRLVMITAIPLCVHHQHDVDLPLPLTGRSQSERDGNGD